MKTAFLALIAILSTSLCHAAPPRSETQAGMNDDAGASFKRTDAEMTSLYQKITKRYSAGPQADAALVKRLRAAQRAWIAFRDAQIEAVFPADDTHFSARPMCVLLLRIELTRARIKQLDEWWTGIEEGDICCGSRAIRQ